MTEGVGGDMFVDAGSTGVFFDNALDGAGGKTTKIARSVDGAEIFGIIKEKGRERIGANIKIILSSFGGGFRDKDRAVFLAFAADDKLATLEVDRVAIKADKFGNTETARKKEFDDGTVTKTGFTGGVDVF